MPAPRHRFVILFDAVEVAAVAVMVVAFPVALASVWGWGQGQMLLGAWVLLLTVWSMPALVVLWQAPPPRKLRERSALVAGAAWFGRAAAGVGVFLLSIVAGSVAGVIAAKAAEDGTPGQALTRAWISVASFAVPVMAGVLVVLFIAMGVRWLIDIGTLVRTGVAQRIIARTELRWFGTKSDTRIASSVRGVIEAAVVEFFGRIALTLLLLTQLVVVSAAIATGFNAAHMVGQ